MKKIYWFIVAIVIVTLLVLLFSFINRDRMLDKMIEIRMSNSLPNLEYLEDEEGIRIVTLGTASPLPSERNQSSTAIFVAGKFFLFDVGYGSIRHAENALLPLTHLSDIFITHWHSDHFIDLPYAINRSWQLGRKNHLKVYGPSGIDTVMSGVRKMMKYENQHRIIHHGEDVMIPDLGHAISQEIDLDGNSSKVVYKKDGVMITAFETCHEPILKSFGFKIEYKGKSVVISGDTKENCPTVEQFATGVDLLLHEAMLKDIYLKLSHMKSQNGDKRIAQIAQDITEYHTSPEDIGILAQKAQVKKVILHHFAPTPSNLILSRKYQSDIQKNYKGPVSLAEDGSEFYIQ